MRTAAGGETGREQAIVATLLVAGIELATLTEAIAGTVLSLGRADMIGDTHATPDEFAWLDVNYTALKFIGFMTAAPLMNRINARHLIVAATLAMGATCGLAAATSSLELLAALRTIQGFSGGVLLVAGQTVIFLTFPKRHQPILQALFAMGAVVAPATMVPALQGWMIDSRSWIWIFFSVVPIALASSGLLLLADYPAKAPVERKSVDWLGLVLISVSLFCFTYVLSQGSRWDWFEEPRIIWLAVIGTTALLAFVGQQILAKDRRLIDASLFASDDFCFALFVSFVAGAALFGSAFLIPSFATSVLSFTPTDAGRLLLPSSALFIASLLVAAWLMQVRRVPPIATVPFGIVLIMVAMWMLSRSSGESGIDDMMVAILLRGLGLGFLFLSITLVAFIRLDEKNLATGIGLFNAGRQLGGLMGVAALQTMINDNVAANLAVLGANLTSADPAVVGRLAATTSLLMAHGLDTVSAGRAAAGLLGKAVVGQSTVIAFDTAFIAIALLFVVAAPVLVTIKIVLARQVRARPA